MGLLGDPSFPSSNNPIRIGRVSLFVFAVMIRVPHFSMGSPLYWVDKGKKDSQDHFRKARSPEKMGELDRDLCNFWKEVPSTNTTLPTSSIIKFKFYEDQLDFYIGLSLHSTWIFLPVPSLFYFFIKFVRITLSCAYPCTANYLYL